MAAIIAQLTLNARRRKARGKWYISADKSNYLLQPFDNNYCAEKHNPYLKNQILYEKQRASRNIAKGNYFN